MPAKPEATEPAAEKPGQAELPAVVKAPSGAAQWIPAVAAVLLAPVLCVAVVQLVLVPRFQKKLGPASAAAQAAPAAAEPSAAPKAAAEGKQAGAGSSYDFTNVVVNLSGTMGTRYLKTSFTVTGSDAAMKQAFETNKARFTDVTLNVLSTLTLAELEEPGAKNLIRDKLVASYNQAIGHHSVDQVYFSDFLIQ